MPDIDKLFDQLAGTMNRRDQEDKECERLTKLLQVLIRGQARKIVEAGAEGVYIDTREVRIHGYALRHSPCTLEHTQGAMLVLQAREHFWLVTRHLAPCGGTFKEFSTAASRLSTDSFDGLLTVWNLLKEPAVATTQAAS